MDILEWSHRHLVLTGAAEVCRLHGLITATENVGAVNRAVSIGRKHPLSTISPDGAELAILHTYLSLPDTSEMCEREQFQAPT